MKKSYHCEKLEKTLQFCPNGVKFCCSYSEGLKYEIKDFEKLSTTEIENARNKYISMLKNGNIPKGCNGCLEYKEISLKEQIINLLKNKEERKIKHIIIDHFKQCDCNCTYCAQKILFPNITQNYDVLPLIKQLYNQNMISKEDLTVEFQGGNISCLKEFDSLIQEFNKNSSTKFIFLMNGIKYIPTIEQSCNDIKNHICISLDAGTKETFKKIKNVDAFDEVIANIKKLRNNTEISIGLKYIIIKDVNDNLEELTKFLDICKEIGNIHPIYLEIDYNDTLMNHGIKFQIPSHYYELFKKAEEYCNENNLNYMLFPHTKKLLDEGYSS